MTMKKDCAVGGGDRKTEIWERECEATSPSSDKQALASFGNKSVSTCLHVLGATGLLFCWTASSTEVGCHAADNIWDTVWNEKAREGQCCASLCCICLQLRTGPAPSSVMRKREPTIQSIDIWVATWRTEYRKPASEHRSKGCTCRAKRVYGRGSSATLRLQRRDGAPTRVPQPNTTRK